MLAASCLLNHPSQLPDGHVVRLTNQLLQQLQTVCFFLMKGKQYFYFIKCEGRLEKHSTVTL